MLKAIKNSEMKSEFRRRKSFYESDYSRETVAKCITNRILENR